MSQLNPTPLSEKSTTDQIRERFDQDVDRFSVLETGQSATIDAPVAMELITQAAVAMTRPIRRVLDVGCGAGNNTIKLRQTYGQNFDVDLLDLSQPMIRRATERVAQAGANQIRHWHTDLRDAELPENAFDVVLAAAVLHHLRDDADWESAFAKIYRLVAPGGSVWITDLVSHEMDRVHDVMWQRYGEYLISLGGDDYRNKVFEYIDREDSPRPVTYQLDLLQRVGFDRVELLHKNSCFAAFGAWKR
ncbi:class I SAM-dependent methyltransferase [Crateriforma conspicua]|nr:class I SAM-dependent methyltransferase [Crateriforma conspicua]